MITRASALILLLVPLLASCRKETSKTEYLADVARFENLYSSENITTAEQALFSYLNYLESAKRQGIKYINYDSSGAVLHARLFVLYGYMNAPEKAEKHYQLSLQFWRNDEQRWNRPPATRTPELLTQRVLEKYDKHLDVRWRKKLNSAKAVNGESLVK